MEQKDYEKIKCILENKIAEYDAVTQACDERICEAMYRNLKGRLIRFLGGATGIACILLMYVNKCLPPVNGFNGVLLALGTVGFSLGTAAFIEKKRIDMKKYSPSKGVINWLEEEVSQKLKLNRARRRKQALNEILEAFSEYAHSLEILKGEHNITFQRPRMAKEDAQAIVESGLITQHFGKLDVLATQEMLEREFNEELVDGIITKVKGVFSGAYGVIGMFLLYATLIFAGIVSPSTLLLGLVATAGFGITVALFALNNYVRKQMFKKFNAELGEDALPLHDKNSPNITKYERAIEEEILVIVGLAKQLQRAREDLDRMEEERQQYRLVETFKPIQSLDENLEAAQEAAHLDEPTDLGEKPFVMRPIGQ